MKQYRFLVQVADGKGGWIADESYASKSAALHRAHNICDDNLKSPDDEVTTDFNNVEIYVTAYKGTKESGHWLCRVVRIES